MSIAAVEMVLSMGGSYVVAQTDATLEIPADILELAKKEDSKWGATLQGQQDFSVSGATIFQDSTQANPVGADGVVSVGAGGSDVLGLTSVEVTFTNGFTEVGDVEDPLWTFRRVSEKEMELSLSGYFKDPNNTDGAGLDNILTAKENGNVIPLTLDFGDLTFSGDIRPGDVSINSNERGDQVETDVTLQHDGPITLDSGTLDTGQEAILNSWFDESILTATLEHIQGDPATDDPVDGSTFYEGDTLVETVTLSAERQEDLGLEFDLAGNGALTRNVYTAT